MARKVFLYIGLPKTGTTYLQSIVWSSRLRLLEDGVLLPGKGHREHLWAALELRGSRVERRDPHATGSLRRLVQLVNDHPENALLTHEFMCAAGRGQSRRLVESLQPAEVHVIVSARDALGMLTAGWTEYVKNGGSRSLSSMTRAPGRLPPEFSWRTWDLGGVLRRWGTSVKPERVHVLAMPGSGSPPDQHWRNFASVLGIDATAYETPDRVVNPALGVAQVELLRRINPFLKDFRRPVDRGTWIRGHLAERYLGGQSGRRLGADQEQIEECRRRSEAAVEMVRSRGFHTVGDAESLLVPDALPDRLNPGDVNDGVLLEAAVRLVADMLSEMRRVSNGNRAAN